MRIQVSEASRNILDSNKQENKRLLREMSNMQQVTFGAKKQMNEFMEKAENHYMENAFSVAEQSTFMEDCLQKW